MPYCVAFGCDNSTDKVCPGVSFHRLPVKNPPLLKQWLASLRLESPPVHDANARVCSEHFSPDSFTTYMKEKLLDQPGGRRRLKNDAIPTIFTFSLPPKRRTASEGRENVKRLRSAIDDAFEEYHTPTTIAEPAPSIDKYCSIGVQTSKYFCAIDVTALLYIYVILYITQQKILYCLKCQCPANTAKLIQLVVFASGLWRHRQTCLQLRQIVIIIPSREKRY